jgi:TolB protein
VVATPVLSAESLGADVFSPAFAGDGEQLLFHAGRTSSALLRASFDVRSRPTVTTVLDDGAANYHATQSPDGRWLAFDSDRDGTRGVYVAPADFTDALAVRRVSGRGYAAVPRWSPDGRSLAFARAELRRPRVWNVWIANLDDGTLSRVSDHRVGQAWSASWFPSGEQLAYSVEDWLVVVDLGRGTRRRFQSPRPGHLVRTPAVSPDGRWIVFQVHRDGTWLFDVSSERMRRVLDDPRAEEFSWSPDGRRVLYHTKGRAGWSVWQFALPPDA